MSEHTPEPWGLRTVLHGAMNVKGLGIIQAETVPFTVTECIAFIDPEELVGDLQRANARRIVACVNACRGMSTEELEEGISAGLTLKETITKLHAAFEIATRKGQS